MAPYVDSRRLSFLHSQLLEKHGSNLDAGMERISALLSYNNPQQGEPVKVCITGAAGQLGYALVFRIARFVVGSTHF